MRVERNLLKSQAPMAALQLLSRGAMYGYELSEALEESSRGVLALGRGTLYPLLYNLEAKRLIHAEWEVSENGRERRYYSITGKGKKYLAVRREEWERLQPAMRMVLEYAVD